MFLIIVISKTLFVWYTDTNSLFTGVLNKPKIWLLFLVIFTLLSVYPQELLFRTYNSWLFCVHYWYGSFVVVLVVIIDKKRSKNKFFGSFDL